MPPLMCAQAVPAAVREGGLHPPVLHGALLQAECHAHRCPAQRICGWGPAGRQGHSHNPGNPAVSMPCAPCPASSAAHQLRRECRPAATPSRCAQPCTSGATGCPESWTSPQATCCRARSCSSWRRRCPRRCQVGGPPPGWAAPGLGGSAASRAAQSRRLRVRVARRGEGRVPTPLHVAHTHTPTRLRPRHAPCGPP